MINSGESCAQPRGYGVHSAGCGPCSGREAEGLCTPSGFAQRMHCADCERTWALWPRLRTRPGRAPRLRTDWLGNRVTKLVSGALQSMHERHACAVSAVGGEGGERGGRTCARSEYSAIGSVWQWQ